MGEISNNKHSHSFILSLIKDEVHIDEGKDSYAYRVFLSQFSTHTFGSCIKKFKKRNQWFAEKLALYYEVTNGLYSLPPFPCKTILGTERISFIPIDMAYLDYYSGDLLTISEFIEGKNIWEMFKSSEINEKNFRYLNSQLSSFGEFINNIVYSNIGVRGCESDPRNFKISNDGQTLFCTDIGAKIDNFCKP